MLDFAISHGCYKTALMIMNNTKLTPKTPDEYRAHSEKNQIMWFDYEIMVDHLNLKVESEMVPVFN
jgi:hypothetical protein